MFLALLLVASPSLATDEDFSMIFLVRHAEKLEGGDDPRLSAAGKQRAERLAGMLADAGITGIYSTDYARTRETAAPLARATDLGVTLYDPSEPTQFTEFLKKKPGRHLVIGHSNTVPDLVDRLGGTPGPDIDEESEYDRLYIVTRDGVGKVSTVLLRY